MQYNDQQLILHAIKAVQKSVDGLESRLASDVKELKEGYKVLSKEVYRGKYTERGIFITMSAIIGWAARHWPS